MGQPDREAGGKRGERQAAAVAGVGTATAGSASCRL